ncbi:hypothetical protein SAMN05216436_11317 [bacterium A37T11]|nr:hypothetical protein SAMN05216436_11317 [bacterium A37T11]
MGCFFSNSENKVHQVNKRVINKIIGGLGLLALVGMVYLGVNAFKTDTRKVEKVSKTTGIKVLTSTEWRNLTIIGSPATSYANQRIGTVRTTPPPSTPSSTECAEGNPNDPCSVYLIIPTGLNVLNMTVEDALAAGAEIVQNDDNQDRYAFEP